MSPKVLLKLGPAMPPNWTPKFIWGGGGGSKNAPFPRGVPQTTNHLAEAVR